MFPIENMPQIIQYFTYLMPIRYFAIIVRSIFLKGTGIDVLWIQGLCLLVLGLSILLLSILRFKKKIT
jgi:ABC-2 type transport system permease protein